MRTCTISADVSTKTHNSIQADNGFRLIGMLGHTSTCAHMPYMISHIKALMEVIGTKSSLILEKKTNSCDSQFSFFFFFFGKQQVGSFQNSCQNQLSTREQSREAHLFSPASTVQTQSWHCKNEIRSQKINCQEYKLLQNFILHKYSLCLMKRSWIWWM